MSLGLTEHSLKIPDWIIHQYEGYFGMVCSPSGELYRVDLLGYFIKSAIDNKDKSSSPEVEHYLLTVYNKHHKNSTR